MKLWPRWLRNEVEGTESSQREAQEKLGEVRGQWPEVREITTRLRVRDDKNEYAEALRRVLGHGSTG
jgi:hypothetical protein